MKQLTKKIVAVICVVAMLVGVIVPNGLTLNTKAADTATQSTEATDNTAREWWVYGDDSADTGLVLTGSGSRKSISDAGVNLPEGLIEANLSLQIKLNVSATDDVISALNSANAATFELANEVNDAGELSWNCGSLVSGENNLIFSFVNASHTNGSAVNGIAVQDGKSPFDWEETIDFFGLYLEGYSTDATALSITVESVKIVYTDAGLTFGADDTYLQLDSAMSATPNAVEATVNMDSTVAKAGGWILRNGDDTTTTSGHVLTVGKTTANDAPGAGMSYTILDATNSAISGFGVKNAYCGINAKNYELKDLAIAVWVYAENAGALANGGQLRLGSNEDNVSSNFIYFNCSNKTVKAGWNYVTFPLNTYAEMIGTFTTENINTMEICEGFNLAKSDKRYFGKFSIVVLEDEWLIREGSNTTTTSGHTLTTGVTTANEAPGAGMKYSVLDASSTAVSGFGIKHANLGIDASDYNLDELAIAFWVYAEKAGTLANGGQLRFGSNADNVSSNFIYFVCSSKTVKAGWNYITFPLNTYAEMIGTFATNSINTLEICEGFNIAKGDKRYFGDIMLIVLEDESEWTIRSGNDTTTQSGHVLTTGTTVSGEAPGEGMVYSVLDATNSGVSGFEIKHSNLGIDASSYGLENLAIEFWLYAENAGKLANGGQLRLGNNADNVSSNFIYFACNRIDVNAGWNYVSIPLNTRNELIGSFTTGKINTLQICEGFGIAKGDKRYFGDIKLVASPDTAWTMCDTTTTYDNGYGLSYSAGSVSDAEKHPSVGTTYAKIQIPQYDVSIAETGKFGFELPMTAFDVSSNPSNYAVAFWLYSSTGVMPNGQIEINSSGTVNDANELDWYPQSLGIQKGWNYVTLNLGQPGESYGEVDYSSINYLRWYSDNGEQTTQSTVLAITDIQLIALDTNAVVKTLCAAENQPLWYGLSKSIYTVKEGPEIGTTYMETTIPVSKGFGFFTGFDAINAQAYEPSSLVVSFWIYTQSGKLPNGQIEINSSGTPNDGAELVWFPQNFNSQLQIGWNKIELNLGSPHHTGGSGIDFSNINYIRWYTDDNDYLTADTMFRIGEITLYAASIDEGNVLVSNNVVGTLEQYMIFSNSNRSDESNSFALFITQEGYPAVLYGTTQFVLEQNICTGNDVKLKIARNSMGTISFYIDGQLVGTSKTRVSALGAPITPYSIGADGAGAQTFVGTIKDVKTYSDASASACTGNWPLIGDIRYVVETMPDVSGNGNNATFKGTRANDWYDVEAIGEDDWSLVFIPDIVQRFYRSEHAIWHRIASWIGDNVEKENIKYVIGAKTADPAQAGAVNYGHEFFDSAVPTTNFNTAEENSYYRFSVNGVKWGILSLKKGWDADATAVFAWGKDIIAQYPYDNIIITCDNYYNSIWSEFYSKNVKLIVYGSQGAEPTEDAPVMNFPAQNDLENNYFGEQGLGLMYMLRFTEGGTKVTARSYAPIYDSYFTGVVNYEKTFDTVKAPEVKTEKYTGATPGVAPTDIPEGMLFAGWFTASGIAEEWTLHEGQYFGPNGGASMTPGSYVTTAEDEPGEGMTCFVLDASSQGITFDGFQHQDEALNVNSYSPEELAISFWVHSNKDGNLDPGPDGGQLRLAVNNDIYTVGNFIYYPMRKIDVQEGWNYVEVPLSKFSTEAGENFSLSAITTWGIMNTHTVPSGMVLKYGDIKLVRYGADCSKESALKEATTGTAYARFVDKDLLTVKAQIRANTSDQSNYSDIRFVTSVDRLEYKRMGFEISYERDNGTIKEIKGGATENNIVYQKLYVVGANGGEPEGYTPKEIISANSVYFKAYTITNVPNRAFDRDFNVRAYWVTMDGTKVYGDYVDKSVWMGYQTKGEFLPVIVNTTYETDDVVIADVVLTEEKYGYLDDVVDGDWSTALQNALIDVHNNGGGTVYVPAGEYKLTKSITIPSDVTLHGDWQDPDKGTEYGTIFNIYPTQEITAYRNVDAAHNQNTAAFVMTGSSGVVGVTAYYPNQSIADGSAVPYPYTFYVTVGNDGGQLITLKNITVINGYRGVGTRYEMQHEALIIDNFKGTFLDCGMAIYNSSDTGTISNVSISSKYWNDKDGTDASDYVKNTTNVTAIELGDLEWHQLSNCSIDGYNVGISVVPGYRTNFSGSMIDMKITGCATGITIADEINDTYYGNLNIKEVGDADTPDKQEYPLNKALDPRWGLVIARSTIEGSTNAIVNNGKASTGSSWLVGTKVNRTPGLIRMTDVAVDGNIVQNTYTKDDAWASADYNVQSSSEDLGTVVDATAQYNATYTVTAAQKKNLWVVEGIEAYDGANVDVSELINTAMDKVLERNADGGIVYVPGGTYRLDNPITVPAGVELHGASSVANREQYMDGEGTLFMVYYGDDDNHKTTDTALVTLAGDNSGISGVRFLYPENISTNVEEAADQAFYSTYTIAANGASNVHVTNCFIATSSYGVNLQNCNDFHVENLFTCVYRNTINVADSTGVIRGAWTNPNAIARTTAKGLTDNWPEEAVYNNSTAPINIIRNYLKDNLTFIQVSGSTSDVLIHNITAYAHNKTVSQSGGNVLVMNSNADSLEHENGVQFTLSNGTMKVINALRAAITDTGSSQDADPKFLHSHTGGKLSIYNSIMAKSTEKNSAWEDNYNTTK